MKEEENIDFDIMDGMAEIFAEIKNFHDTMDARKKFMMAIISEMDERTERLSAEVDKIIAKMKRVIEANDKENFC